MSHLLQLESPALLPHSPECASSVRWSEDNLLAVAQGSSIYLLHPGHLEGARALCLLPEHAQGPELLPQSQLPASPSLSVEYDLLCLRRGATKGVGTSVRCLDWSPRDIDSGGGCVLAVVTKDHRVLVYAPATRVSNAWEICWELSWRKTERTEDAERMGSDVAAGSSAAVPPRRQKSAAVEKTVRTALDGAKRRADEVTERAENLAEAENGSGEESFQAPSRSSSRGRARGRGRGRGRGRQREQAVPLKIEKEALSMPAADTEPPPQDPAPPDVPSDTAVAVVDVSSAASIKATLPNAFAAMFLYLRQALPKARRPRYPGPSSHLKEADLGILDEAAARLERQYGAAARSHGLADFPNLIECRRGLRLAWDRVRDRIRPDTTLSTYLASDYTRAAEKQAAPVSPRASTDAILPSSRDTRRRSAARSAPSTNGSEASSVDGGAEANSASVNGSKANSIDDDHASDSAVLSKTLQSSSTVHWRSLPAVDVRSGTLAARRSLTNAAVRRFLLLREEVPAAMLPHYRRRNDHLKDADAEMVSRTTAEFLAAFPRLMAQLDYASGGAFQALWTNRLRKCWDKASGSISGIEMVSGVVGGGGGGGDGVGSPEADDPVLSNLPMPSQEAAKSTPGEKRTGGGRKKRPGRARREEEVDLEPSDQEVSGCSISSDSCSTLNLSSSSDSESELLEDEEDESEAMDESDEGSVISEDSPPRRIPGGRKPRAPAASAPRRPARRSGPIEVVDSAIYDRDLLVSCPESLAWSPGLCVPELGLGAAHGGPAALLAVGTRGGTVHVWLVRGGGAAGETARSCVGSFDAGGARAGWITALAWAPCCSADAGRCYVAAGSSSGAVGVWEIQLAANETQSDSFSRSTCTHCVQVMPGDGRPVRSLDCCRREPGGFVLLAVGRAAGCVSAHLIDASRRSCVASCEATQGTRDVASVQWAPPLVRPAAEPCALVSATLDGVLGFRRVAGSAGSDSPGLSMQDCAQPLECLSKGGLSQGWLSQGLAAAPGGLFACGLQLALHPDMEYTKQLQTHTKVVLATAHLLALPAQADEPTPPERCSRMLDGLVGGLGAHVGFSSAALWSLASGVCVEGADTGADWARALAGEVASRAQAGSGVLAAGGAVQVQAAAAVAAMLLHLLRGLEGEEAWRDAAGVLTRCLDGAEQLLLERHLRACLELAGEDGADDEQKSVGLRAAAWVAAQPPETLLDSDLVSLSESLKSVESRANLTNEPKIESFEAGGVQAATKARICIEEGYGMVVPRCARTLAPLLSLNGALRCPLCQRRYLAVGGAGTCLFHNLRLVPHHLGELVLSTPCLG